jgi:stage V sporulation protein SpoVS
MNKKQTSKKVASKASAVLKDSKSKTVKSVAASALSQTKKK